MTPAPLVRPDLPCEIALIAGKQRMKAHLWLPESALKALAEAAERLESDLAGQGLGFSFLPDTDMEVGTSRELAKDLAETLFSETDFDWKGFRAAAKAVDAEAKARKAEATDLVVDFAWNNGGGDDHLFTQAFRGVPGTDATQAFEEGLKELWGLGHFYDLNVGPRADGDPAVRPLAELLAWSATTPDAEPLTAFLEHASRAHAEANQAFLDAALPLASPRKPFRM